MWTITRWFIGRNNTCITLEGFCAQNEIEPLYEIILNEFIVLFLQLIEKQEIQLLCLFQENKLIDHFSNEEVFIDKHEEEPSEKLFRVYILFECLITKYLVSNRLEYDSLQLNLFISMH